MQQGKVYSRPESRFLWIEYRTPEGRKVRKSSKTANEREARKLLEQELRRLQSLSFQEAVVEFFETKVRHLRGSTLRNYQISLRNVDPFLGNLMLEEIDADRLKQFIAFRRKSVSDATIKRDLAFVSSVFSHAIETLPKGPRVNPVMMLPKRNLRESPRSRWLRKEEFELLLGACSNDMQRMILRTAVYTGMRHGELVALRKHHLDFSRQEVLLNEDMTKSRRERVVPLCDWLCSELEQLCETVPGDMVFCYQNPLTHTYHPYQGFTNWWKAVRRRSGIKDLRFHDLRHTFASWFMQGGGDVLLLKAILGHSSITMSQGYAHLSTASIHTAIRHSFGTDQDKRVLSV